MPRPKKAFIGLEHLQPTHFSHVFPTSFSDEEFLNPSLTNYTNQRLVCWTDRLLAGWWRMTSVVRTERFNTSIWVSVVWKLNLSAQSLHYSGCERPISVPVYRGVICFTFTEDHHADHKCVHPATAGHLISLLCPINLYIEPPTSHWHWLYS